MIQHLKKSRNIVKRTLANFVLETRALACRRHLELSWLQNSKSAGRHELPGMLAVSLTSYPPRFQTLALTLKSIFGQSVRADAVILWIAEQSFDELPLSVTELQSHGLLIKRCRELRSYKKIVPLLQEQNECFIVTADDDVYYRRHWLRDLVREYDPNRREVICGRAHRITLDTNGLPHAYNQWEHQVRANGASSLLFPTGVGGVLYPPGIFCTEVTRIELFTELCPYSDDIWLYWMASMNGAVFRKVGPRTHPTLWPNTQGISLARINIDRFENDAQIKRMTEHYGFPAKPAGSDYRDATSRDLKAS
jgi:hypothetical protein